MSDTGSIVSMGVLSDGSYGIAEGLFFSFPIRCAGGDWKIVQGLSVNDYSRGKLDITEGELKEERDLVADLLP